MSTLTNNLKLNKPEETEHYNVTTQNENMDKIDAFCGRVDNPHKVTKAQVGLSNVPNVTTNNQTPTFAMASSNTDLISGEVLSTSFGKIAKAINSLISHLANTSNPHNTTASQVGLGNVPNVATNNQKPTYTVASSNTDLTSGEALSTAFGKIAKAVNSLISHLANTSNPHSVTKSQVGLGNVPNVTTNDQAPTYTVASTNTALVSGEKLSVSFGKIAKAINSLISHLADTVGHITSAERTKWNAKLDATATATNADKLDGLDSTSFMRSVKGYGTNVFGSYDLNTWVMTGCYSCEGSCTNVPPDTDGWADLLVFGGIDGRVTQLYRPWNKNYALYFRSLNGTTWTGWQNLSDFMKLTGGTMAGNIDLNNHKIMGCAGTYAPALQDHYSHAGIEIREKDFIMNGSTDLGYAPTLGFHWAGAMGGAILMDASGNFHFINGNGNYSTLKTGTANVIISDTAPTDTTALWVS